MRGHNPLDIREQDQRREDKDHRARLVRETEDSDFLWLMKNPRGRRIVWGLLSRVGVFRSSFNTNAMQMACNEGGRNEGLKILDDINRLCPELYVVMLQEATAKESKHE